MVYIKHGTSGFTSVFKGIFQLRKPTLPVVIHSGAIDGLEGNEDGINHVVPEKKSRFCKCKQVSNDMKVACLSVEDWKKDNIYNMRYSLMYFDIESRPLRLFLLAHPAGLVT